jgi:hypothetical protein
MKTLIAAGFLAVLLSGCATDGLNNPHADGIAAPPPDQGPELCQDGSAPPCPKRS